MDTTPMDGTSEFDQPEQVFESAARRLFELSPAAHCRLLGIESAGPPQVLPDPLAPITLPGDILLVRVGPERLAHITYVLHRPADLEARMLLYRTAILNAYPKDEVTQHVIVLGDEDT